MDTCYCYWWWKGLLTDHLTRERFEDGSIRAVRMTGCTWEELQPLRGKLEEIAQARGKTMAQVDQDTIILLDIIIFYVLHPRCASLQV